MVMFPEDDMFLWKTQAIDTPSRMDAECRIEIIQGGHWSMLDHPDDVNEADAGLVRALKASTCPSRCERGLICHWQGCWLAVALAPDCRGDPGCR